jgi:hypothetical protein
MLNYFKDEKGILHCVAGELPIFEQRRCRRIIEHETNLRVKSAVLALVVDNPPDENVDDPLLA